MIGIVVAAHGHLASELVATAALIIGELPRVTACNVKPGLSPQALEQELREALARVDDGDGVLVLADLIGGTPCTRSIALCQSAQLEVVTGVSLPVLLKAHSLRQGRVLRDVAAATVEAGRGAIRWATERLSTLPGEAPAPR